MSTRFKFEYVTGAVFLQHDVGQSDGIVVHVVNDSDLEKSAHAIIYKNTHDGAIVAADSGFIVLVSSWTWRLCFAVPESGDYRVSIKVSSEDLIPDVSFERFQSPAWFPVVSYKPGDFAVFTLKPRKRIWEK